MRCLNLSERLRISIQIEQKQMAQIETRIKAEYPKFRNVSELVRAALVEYLGRTIKLAEKENP